MHFAVASQYSTPPGLRAGAGRRFGRRRRAASRQGQTDDLRFCSRRDRAMQPVGPGRQFRVHLRPYGPRVRVIHPLSGRAVRPARAAGRRTPDLGLVRVVAAEWEQLGTLDRDEQESVREPVRRVGRRQLGPQLVGSDVADDADVRAGCRHRIILCQGPQVAGVPALTNRRRQCVTRTLCGAQRAGEFRLDDEQPLVSEPSSVISVPSHRLILLRFLAASRTLYFSPRRTTAR